MRKDLGLKPFPPLDKIACPSCDLTLRELVLVVSSEPRKDKIGNPNTNDFLDETEISPLENSHRGLENFRQSRSHRVSFHFRAAAAF
jgi:hypothetical protein